jgi:hypothetical protein
MMKYSTTPQVTRAALLSLLVAMVVVAAPAAATSTPTPLACSVGDVDFEGLAAGTQVTSQISGISVTAVNHGGGPDVAVIFDTANPRLRRRRIAWGRS